MRAFTTVGILLLSAFAAPAWAAEKPPIFVVLVGIGEHADKAIAPRRHAEADAIALYDLLTNAGHLGVDSEHIRLLLGKPDTKRPSTPATRDNILKAIRWAATEAADYDLVLFAFIGQGAPLGDKTCYFASDSTFRGRAKDALTAASIEEELGKLKSQTLCAFLDVDFHGFNPGESAPPDLNERAVGREFLGKDDLLYPAGRVVYLAGTAGRPSPDLDAHGSFAQVVLDGLMGAADKDGGDADGVVTAGELSSYLDAELRALSQKHGKTDEERKRIPRSLQSGSSQFVLTRNPAVYAGMERRVEKLEQLAVAEKFPPDVVREGLELLRRTPRYDIARKLRKAYQNLADGIGSSRAFMAERAKYLEARKLDETVAIDFALQVGQATELLRRRYYRELNHDELIVRAVRGLYHAAEERIPRTLEKRLNEIGGLEFVDKLAVVSDARRALGNRDDLADNKDVDAALKHTLAHLDPYTTILDAPAMARLRWQQNNANLGEIGIQVHRREDGSVEVVTPFKDGPAYKAGIKTGDVLIRLKALDDAEGKPLDEPTVVVPGTLSEEGLERMLRGKPNSRVEVVVRREGNEKPLTFAVAFARVKKEKLVGVKRRADDTWDYVLDAQRGIYYIGVLDFHGPDTARELDQLLIAFETRNMSGLILDLRYDSGGLIDTAVGIADNFIDDGLIVEFRWRKDGVGRRMGNKKGSHLRFPMVCLIGSDGGTCPVIVASSLQDHHRALIVGERTGGKASVQNYAPLDHGVLRITTSHAYRPNGKPLDRTTVPTERSDEWGVVPDDGYLIPLSNVERKALGGHLSARSVIPRRDLPQKEPPPDLKDRQLNSALERLRRK